MFDLKEIKLMFLDPTDLIINNINKYLYSNKAIKFISKRIYFPDSLPINSFLWQSKRFLSARIFSSQFFIPTIQKPSPLFTPLARNRY